MEYSSQLPAGHGHNHPSVHHASRQLLSRPEVQVASASFEPIIPASNAIAAPVVPRPPTALVPAAEARAVPSAPLPVPLPVTSPTNTVPVLTHVVTPTPVVKIASVAQPTATSVSSAKTNLPQPSCSPGIPCASMAVKSPPLVSALPQQTQAPQQFLASLSSNPAAIFFTCLAGIALVGVMLAILSCALRSWCNRRRRNTLDEDAWRFLENSRDFADPMKEDDEETSMKSSQFRSDSQSRLAHLQPTLAKNYMATNPFPSHTQQQAQQPVPQHRFAPFQTQDEQHMNGFIDEKGLGWIAPPVPVSSQYSGVLFTPGGPTPELMESYQRGCTIPELVYRKASLAGSFCNRATMYASPTQAPVPAFTRPASVITRSSTTTTTPDLQNRLNSLTREASLACSDHSTTVEELRERVTDQHTDLRATLRGAIQKDKKADDDLLESLISLWHDKTTEAQKASILLQTPQLPPTNQA